MKVLCNVANEDVDTIENKIIQLFCQRYKLVRGREWFEGDASCMKRDIDEILKMYNCESSKDHATETTVTSSSKTETEFPCPNCYRVFHRKCELDYHIPLCKHVKSNLECHKCHRMFASRQSKANHIIRCEAANM